MTATNFIILVTGTIGGQEVILRLPSLDSNSNIEDKNENSKEKSKFKEG